MFETHSELPDLIRDNAELWRYVDLSMYLDLLQTSELHFARVDLMFDRWEGAYGPYSYAKWQQELGRLAELVDFGELRQEEVKIFRTHSFLNCWHASAVESAAMWSIYDREQRGVAIKTTRGRIRKALRGSEPVYGATVEYIDYSATEIPWGNAFTPFRYKRSSFAHEREYRLIRTCWPDSPNGPADPSAQQEWGWLLANPPTGIREPVDLEGLVESVRVSPEAPGWYRDVVERVTRTYGHIWDVTMSDLSQDPVI